jgi:WD40 repeat protein/tRNA A-37 threonylcarbamoyl transferase component Bud32
MTSRIGPTMSSTVPGDTRLSPDGASRLGGLLAGLDRLDPILGLPEYPLTADPPCSFGRFKLRARLGSGAHGVVLLAYDPRLGREVVVKVTQPAVLADPELRERFVREARAAAGLEHPGIVPLFEAGEIDGLPYLAAGYVTGPSLANWLAAHPGPAPPADAAQLVAAVAAAVHHAHERGVLHCDLTPSNVLLAPADPAADGLASYRPAITDFGHARLTEEDPALTRTFRIAGTPLYMAPEQARGERRNLTARTDIYALGAILYHLLTGRPPHDGETTPDVLRRIVSEPVPSPHAVNRQVSRDLAAVCLKCLEPDPGRRYPDGAALAADLGRFLSGAPTVARPIGWPTRAAMWVRRHPVPAALAALSVAALVLSAGREWVNRNELAANNLALRNALTRELEATTDAERQRELAISRYRVLRRRTYLAEIRDAAALLDRGMLTDRAVGGWEPDYGDDLRGFEWAYLTRLARSARTWPRQGAPVAVGPVTDDGRRCATVAGEDIRTWDVKTGRAESAWVHPYRLDALAAVSADGRYAAAARHDDAVILFTRGSNNTSRFPNVIGESGQSPYFGFAGADRLLIAGHDAVRMYDAATGTLVRTFQDRGRHPSGLGIGPAGRTAAVGFAPGPDGYVVLYEVATGRELGRRAAPAAKGFEGYLAVSADETHVLVAHGADLRVWRVADGALRAGFRFPPGGVVMAVGRLDDGRLVAAAWPESAADGRTVTVAIWTPAADGWTTAAVVPPCPVQSVQFRPDGRALVVGGLDSTVHETALIRPAPDLSWPVAGKEEAWAVAVSPNGRTIATGGDDHAVRVWDAATGRLVAERTDHESLVTSAAFAPDGRWFVTGSFDGRVAIRDPGTADRRRALDHGRKVRAVAVSPDGELIAACGATGRVSVWEAATGRLVYRTEGTAPVIHALVFDRDGTLIVPLQEREIVWIDVRTGTDRKRRPIPLRPSCVTLSPAGGLAVGFETGGIVTLDAAGTPKEPWENRTFSRLNALAFAPDGRTLATASDNGSVLLRQADTGELFFPLAGTGPRVHGMAFAADGSFLAAARHDGRLVLWPATEAAAPRP